MQDILDRLRQTLESKLLQKYALYAIGSFALATLGLNLVQATFDPSLVNDTGEYVGNPPLLALGIIAALIGSGGVFYFYAKWRSGAVADRATTLLEQIPPITFSDLEVSRISLAIQKLNTPGHDTEFYSHVIAHYINYERQKLTEQDAPMAPMKLVNDIASFSSTHAYLTQSLRQAEYDLITWASQHSGNPHGSESRASILARLEAIQ